MSAVVDEKYYEMQTEPASIVIWIAMFEAHYKAYPSKLFDNNSRSLLYVLFAVSRIA